MLRDLMIYLQHLLRNKEQKQSAAYNEQFGASGGVARPKGSANLQVLTLLAQV